MAHKNLETKKAEVTAALNEMVSRAGNISGYLNRVVYDQYKLLQIKRWKSYNASMDFTKGRWADLDKNYADWKRRKYKTYAYQGKRIGIATGLLFQSIVGEKNGISFHNKITTNHSLKIFVSLDYAKYYDLKRTTSSWHPKTLERIEKGITNYVRTGELRRGERI